MSEEHNESMQNAFSPNEIINTDPNYIEISGLESDIYIAGFWMRFWAYLVDLIMIGSINRLIIKPIFRWLDISLHDPGIFAPIAIVTTLTFYLYFVFMTRLMGQTIGKMVFGLRVISLKDKKLSWGSIIFREGIGRYISTTIWILYIIVAFTRKKQGLHDIFADTTVIHERIRKQLQPAH
jgi:uncharacterized RDD family membrane protein YckC